jgi:hypothetical protein
LLSFLREEPRHPTLRPSPVTSKTQRAEGLGTAAFNPFSPGPRLAAATPERVGSSHLPDPDSAFSSFSAIASPHGLGGLGMSITPARAGPSCGLRRSPGRAPPSWGADEATLLHAAFHCDSFGETPSRSLDAFLEATGTGPALPTTEELARPQGRGGADDGAERGEDAPAARASLSFADLLSPGAAPALAPREEEEFDRILATAVTGSGPLRMRLKGQNKDLSTHHFDACALRDDDAATRRCGREDGAAAPGDSSVACSCREIGTEQLCKAVRWQRQPDNAVVLVRTRSSVLRSYNTQFFENPKLVAEVVGCVLNLEECVAFVTGAEKARQDDLAHSVRVQLERFKRHTLQGVSQLTHHWTIAVLEGNIVLISELVVLMQLMSSSVGAISYGKSLLEMLVGIAIDPNGNYNCLTRLNGGMFYWNEQTLTKLDSVTVQEKQLKLVMSMIALFLNLMLDVGDSLSQGSFFGDFMSDFNLLTKK